MRYNFSNMKKEKKLKMSIDVIDNARKVFDIELEAVQKTRDCLNDTFIEIINDITNCKGKVIITGMGKSGYIAQKIAASLSSLGSPAFFLHPAEALHGDLGVVNDTDIVIAISYSGESDEITRILPNIKLVGAKIIALSGNKNSTLVKYSDLAQILPEFVEACHMNLAPSSSTTAALVYGDALAIVASQLYGFNEKNYGLVHPAGALGKKVLLTVTDIMAKGEENSLVREQDGLQSAILEMSGKSLGMVTAVDKDGIIKGVFTDGDLRRLMKQQVDIYGYTVEDVMSKDPKLIYGNMMAVEALKVFQSSGVSGLPVIDENKKAIGTLTLSQLVKAGIAN